ncbi:hypothetical protein GCM10020001_043780 [Nonomuraea salmonea]
MVASVGPYTLSILPVKRAASAAGSGSPAATSTSAPATSSSQASSSDGVMHTTFGAAAATLSARSVSMIVMPWPYLRYSSAHHSQPSKAGDTAFTPVPPVGRPSPPSAATNAPSPR